MSQLKVRYRQVEKKFIMFLEVNTIGRTKISKIRVKNGFVQKKMQSKWGGEDQNDKEIAFNIKALNILIF